NSFVNRRCCVIEFLIAHGELSTFPKQVHQPSELRLPSVERRRADGVFATDLSCRNPSLLLPHHRMIFCSVNRGRFIVRPLCWAGSSFTGGVSAGHVELGGLAAALKIGQQEAVMNIALAAADKPKVKLGAAAA